MSGGQGLRASNRLKRAAQLTLEQLEARQLMSTTSTFAVGSALYTAVNGGAGDSGSDLYFSNADGSNQTLMHHWTTNGAITNLFAYNGKLLFDADSSSGSGKFAWASDGTAAGTTQLSDSLLKSAPGGFHLVNGHADFADSALSVYVTDGTSAGTKYLGGSSVPYGVSFTGTSIAIVTGGIQETSDGINDFKPVISESSVITTPADGAGATNIAIGLSDQGYFAITNSHTGITLLYDAKTAKSIAIYGGYEAPDKITIDPSVPLPLNFVSEGQPDVISGGSGNTISFTTVAYSNEKPASALFTDSSVTVTYTDGRTSTVTGHFTGLVEAKSLPMTSVTGAASFQSSSGASATLVGGTLQIIGTAGDDQISLAVADGTLNATINGTVFSTETSQVSSIVVYGGDGNDAISDESGLSISKTVYGDAGDDTLRGSGNFEHFDGGTGDNQIIDEQETQATMVVGNQLYTAIDGSGYFYGSNLDVSNLDGTNQKLVQHWQYGDAINLSTLFAYKNSLLFAASVTNNALTPEPWIADGSGANQLADLHEGASGSNPSAYHLVNGVAIFTAGHNIDFDQQVYVYDGEHAVRDLSEDTFPYMYSPGVRNVVYSDDVVTWDQFNQTLQATQHFKSDGKTTWVLDDDGNVDAAATAVLPTSQTKVTSTPSTPTASINAHVSEGVLRVYGDVRDNTINIDSVGDDLVVSIDGVSKTFASSTVSDVIVMGGDGADTINLNGIAIKSKLYGDAGNDTIYGGAGKDRIYGGDGDDWISGGDNHDTIYGQAGNDKLFGDAGHDYLDGGAGTNTLRGGDGVDHLIFTSGDDIHANAGDKLTVDSIVG